jgi:hypothetical protein
MDCSKIAASHLNPARYGGLSFSISQAPGGQTFADSKVARSAIGQESGWF